MMVELQEPEKFMGIDIDVSNNDIVFTSYNDFKFIYGYDNLKQAVQNRLTTSKGLFENFQEYGSNLNSFLGQKNNEFTINFIKQEVYEILLQEPRIDEISEINITKIDEQTIRFDLRVVPINEQNDINLIWDYFIG